MLFIINNQYLGDYSDNYLKTDESIESEESQSKEDDAHEAGGDD
jgi:hypothetical protein